MKKNILLFVAVFAIGFIGFKLFIPKASEETKETEEPKETKEIEEIGALKLNKGTWVLAQDTLSSLEVTEKQLIFKHKESAIANETYNYSISDQTANDAGIILKIFNKRDTLRYEITAQNDTLLNLLDLNFGRMKLHYTKR